jgi:hypothetical protein
MDLPTRKDLDAARPKAQSIRGRMIFLQEELDWRCYELYGILKPEACLTLSPETCTLHPVPLNLGERAFEILMARKMAKGELETTWFERHGSKPIAEIPEHWPEDYRNLVEQRIALIESDRSIGLIERPEYKRRWNQEPWEEQEKRALRGWLLDRLEEGRYWPESRLHSIRSLAEPAATDSDFMQVTELYVGHPGFDGIALVGELVEDQSVPFLPVLRYKPSGLRKRAIWERTWQLQRQEDAIDTRVAAELTRIGGETDEEYESRLESEQRKRKKAEVGDIAPASQVSVRGLIEQQLLATAGIARRAQGTVRQLSALLTGQRLLTCHRLGGLGPPPTSPGPCGLLHRGCRAGGLAGRTTETPTGRTRGAAALAEAVAQRHRSHVQRAHG